MVRDFSERDLRRALDRLEERFGPVDGSKPPEGDTSASNPRGDGREDNTPSVSDHTEAIIADLSVEQLAKFSAIMRDFDDTEPEPPEHLGTANTEPFAPLGAYSKGRMDADGPTGTLSPADQARLDVVTGGGGYIEVTEADLSAARRLQ